MADKKIEDAIVQISEIYGCNPETVRQLIDLTNGKQGVQFVSIKGYNSDKSLHTEVANHLVNINASYGNMIEKDILTLQSDVNEIKKKCLEIEENWNYERYDLNGVPLEQFRAQVKDQFIAAVEKKRLAKLNPKERENNDIQLNKALYFNTNTLRLAVFGSSLNKTVKQEGVFKKVKSATLTVSGQIVDKALETKTSQLRRFTLDNLNGINLQGETLEIGGGQKEGVEIIV